MTRLPLPFGSRINRDQPITFTFEGQRYSGFEGDVIASALAANGQWVLSRSFKYHRPRGVLSMAGNEADTLVQLPDEPNVQAEFHQIQEGLAATAQNVNGSLKHDKDAILDRLSRFLPVGFYYRTFMGPTQNSWRKLWEPLIRNKAGLGTIDTKASYQEFEKANLFCDLLVVGGGPAGLTAAIEAAGAGADVILAEQEPMLGGALSYRRGGREELEALLTRIEALKTLRVYTGALVNGWFEDNWLPLIQGNKLFKTRAQEVLFATGSIEQSSIFRNNDLPGILLGSAAQRLIHHFGVKPGNQAVVLAANSAGYEVALDLIEAGVEIAAIIDPRKQEARGGVPSEIQSLGIDVVDGSISEAVGRDHVTGVIANGQGYPCDLVVISVGSVPAWQLPCQAGAKFGYDERTSGFSLTMPNRPIRLAGSINGLESLEVIKTDARCAANDALERLGLPHTPLTQSAVPKVNAAALTDQVSAHPHGKDFVDRDEDIQVKDLQNAVKEGYRELELIKRFTTVGMGPSQGRHSAIPTAQIVADATGRKLDQVGVTTARPPFAAEKLGVLAGHHHRAERRTALHQEHIRLGADMRPVGAWRRPYYYGEKNDAEKHIHEEITAVREGVGVLDVSTLGGLEVRGPDAGEFLNRIYTMAYKKQPIGRCRYCLMTNEMGTVVDDGVALRIAEDMYYVTATTGAVARVYADMLFWNAQWGLQVDILNITSAFSGFNITGPAARQVVERLDGDIDFSKASFGYLDGRVGQIAGVPVRAMRIGFTGEVSFEIHCPSSYAKSLWDAILKAGAPAGIRPYGLEASRVLRLEKGHILIGQDTDALTSPYELGFDWAVSKTKPFFIGKRALEMRHNKGLTRKLVGLRFDGPDVPGESCLVLRENVPVGHVTSVAYSPTLDAHIALAYVDARDSEIGASVTVKCRNGTTITSPVQHHVFFDPENTRQEI